MTRAAARADLRLPTHASDPAIAPFVYSALPYRVVFGDGTAAQAPDEADRLGLRRALVITTPRQAADGAALSQRLGTRVADVFSDAAMHTPTIVTDKAMHLVERHGIDGFVAIGGGSSVGLAKALSLRTSLPQLILPTTYAGSEMTPILGETRDGIKTTQRNADIVPDTVIYDVALTMNLSPAMSAASGLNAMAHAIEALYALDANPITTIMAEQSIAALARALPRVVADPGDRAARRAALYGAWLAGTCLGTVGMALHHKLCHVLGGTFDLPHAQTHAIVLPHALAYNAPAAPEAMTHAARALGCADATEGVFALLQSLGLPIALRDIGMPEDGIDRAADLAVRNAYDNPRPIERDAIRGLIARAWRGEPPQP